MVELASLNMVELASLNMVVDRLEHACWNRGLNSDVTTTMNLVVVSSRVLHVNVTGLFSQHPCNSLWCFCTCTV